MYLLEKENLLARCRRVFVGMFDEAVLARHLQSFEGYKIAIKFSEVITRFATFSISDR